MMMMPLAFFAVAPQSIALAAPAKNVIMVMVDGSNASQSTLARWYKGGAPLALDEILVGGQRTYSAESVITDSAPQSVAIATGNKSNTKLIGVLPHTVTIPGLTPIAEELKYKPIANLMEAAKYMGKAAGIIATSNLQHAHPGGFSAHWPDRGNYNEIAKQQAYQSIDLFLGGGKMYMLPQELNGARSDGMNLIEVVKSRGYTVVENREDLLKNKSGKVWGLFANDAMAYDFDRKILRATEPSLAEMTKKAIELLSENPKGFLLYVEASKVDWASHANDPIGAISDTLAWDDAVKVALDFAKKDGNTLVIAFADHGTGGMTIGNKSTDANYDTLSWTALIEPLKEATLTGEGIELKLADDRSESNIRSVMSEYYGVYDLTPAEVTAIQKAKKGSMNYVTGPIITRRSAIGWTTNGHTGEDLFLYAFGPNKPSGLIDNTEIALHVARSLELDLKGIDAKLLVEAGKLFTEIGANVRIDKSDETKLILVVEKNALRAEFPVSTNMMKVGRQTFELKGLTVYSPKTGKVFMPTHALEILKGLGM